MGHQLGGRGWDSVWTVQVGLADVPRYARGGRMLPLLPETQRNTLNRSVVVWTLFFSIATPQRSGLLYEVRTDGTCSSALR